MSNVAVIEGGNLDVEEPDWEALIPDLGSEVDGPISFDNEKLRQMARIEWRRITAALRVAGTLAPENRHQIQRLVLSYIRYDRAAAVLFALGGPITKSSKGVPMLNQWHVEMRQADADATSAEMELGITPRRRNSVGKVKSRTKEKSKSDDYLASTKRAG